MSRALILLAVVGMLGGCSEDGDISWFDNWLVGGIMLLGVLTLTSFQIPNWRHVLWYGFCFAWLIWIAACSAQAAEAAQPSAYKSAVVRYAESFYQMPRPVLTEVWREESSQGLDQRDHDGGTGCGDFGMRTSTASLMLGRDVSCDELKNNFFRAAFLAAEYLWGEAWCGRYRTMELRILCYRTGVNSNAVAEWGNKSWRAMPLDYGTRWIMQRLHHSAQQAMMREAVAQQRTFARD